MGKRRPEGGGAAGWGRDDQKEEVQQERGRDDQKEEVQQDGEETTRRRRCSRMGKRRPEGGGTAGWRRDDKKDEVQQDREETISRRRYPPLFKDAE